MHTEDLYLPGDDEIMSNQIKYLDRLYDFNNTRPTEIEKREIMQKEMFAEIGEGSIVTKDLPDNVVAVGNPCHILREVNEHDREYYFKNRKIIDEDL